MAQKTSIKNKSLKRRIIELSYKYKLSHLGSVLTAVDIIDEIYATKNKNEPFLLSSGHAGLALYAVIEKHEGVDAELILNHHGVHPDRCTDCHLNCSSGSLGQVLPISAGMALSNPEQNVYCLISDGEASEGSIWETLQIKRIQSIDNLKIYVNMNGYSAYRRLPMPICDDLYRMQEDGELLIRETETDLPFTHGVDAHYYILDDIDYKFCMTYFR